MQHVTYYNAFL